MENGIRTEIKPYFYNDNIKIFNDNCLKVLPALESNSIDLVFTSPPYNTGNSGKNKNMYTEYIDDLSDEDYYKLLSGMLSEALRVCKGAVFVNINYMNNSKTVLYKWLSDFSEYLRENIIWDKGPNRSTIPIGNILMKRYEYIFLFTKDPKFEINNFRVNKAEKYKKEFGKWISNLISISVDYENLKHVKVHRAGFPVELPKMFIDIYSKEGDTILDPFMGLGSTPLACSMLKRKFVGTELVKKYCDITLEKLGEFDSNYTKLTEGAIIPKFEIKSKQEQEEEQKIMSIDDL